MKQMRMCWRCAHCQPDEEGSRRCRNPDSGWENTIVSADASCPEFVDRDDMLTDWSRYDDYDHGGTALQLMAKNQQAERAQRNKAVCKSHGKTL